MSIGLDEARACWSAAQGLCARGELSRVPGGWTRSLGGADPYLALRARIPGLGRARVDRALADGELQVVPGVRGCIWLVPAADAALSLRVAAAADRRRLERDITKAGGSMAELEDLGPPILEVLAQGPASTDALRRALPPGSWRGLGDAGKKVGLSTTLPPALRLLEWDGALVRRMLDHRLDHERYLWVLARGEVLEGGPTEALDQAIALARHFFQAAAPATLDELMGWSSLGKGICRQAIEALGLEEIEVEGLGPAWWSHGTELPRVDEAVHLLPGLDNLLAMRGSAAPLVAPAFHELLVPGMGGRPQRLAELTWPMLRPVVQGGRWIGLWEWDPTAGRVVARCFEAPPEGLQPAAEALATFILEELGGAALANGIDSPARQTARAEGLRAMDLSRRPTAGS